MAKIYGTVVDNFDDRGVKVEVRLNPETSVAAANAGKSVPAMLSDAYIMGRSGKKNIGRAVICEAGSKVMFTITTDKGLCGFSTFIKSAEETISEGLYTTGKGRYERLTSWVQRYSDKPDAIDVSNWKDFEKEEGFRRHNIKLSVKDCVAYTKDGASYPLAGAESNSDIGSVSRKGRSDVKYGTADHTDGQELGSMDLHFFVFKDAQAIKDFVESFTGADIDDWGR